MDKDFQISGFKYRFILDKTNGHPRFYLFIAHLPYKEVKLGISKIANIEEIRDRQKALPPISIKNNYCVCESMTLQNAINQGLRRVEEFITKVERHLLDFMRNKTNIEPTPTLWKEMADELINGCNDTEVLMKFCEFGRVYANHKINVMESINYGKNIINTVDKFEQYLKWQDKKDISFTKLTARILINFRNHCLEFLRLSPDTTAMHLSILSAIYNEACKKWNVDTILIDTTNQPFKFVEKKEKMSSRQREVAKKKDQKEYLDKSELVELENSEIKNKERRNALDLELYQQISLLHHELGNRISDLCTMTVQDIFLKKGKYGIYQDTMRKTAGGVAVPLSKKAREIIDTFIIGKSNEDFLLPLLEQKEYEEKELVAAINRATEKYNRALKEIMLQVGINKHISTHSARKAMANKGTQAQAQARLGHTDGKTLKHYRELATDAE